MASVNVEITGDARKLEQTFTKIEAGQDKVEKGFGDVAATAKDSARQIEAANEAAATKGLGSYSRIVAELKRQGPEGRAQAKAIEEYLQAAGKGGRRSIGEIVEELKLVDPAAAEAAEAIKTELAAADQASQFDAALRSLRGLGEAGRATADAIESELRGADEQAEFDRTLASLVALNPAAAEVAERIRVELAAADQASQFDAALRSLRGLGDIGRATAEAIQRELNTADQQTEFDEALASLVALNPAAAEVAERIREEFAAADRQSDFDATLASLRALGGNAAAIADGIRADLQAASVAAAGDMDTILAKLREIDPTVAVSADRVKAELAEAARFSEGRFESTLTRLRSMGPVGRQVATELKTHLVAAGELSERSITDVIEEIRKIDPAAADAAAAIHKNLDDAANKSETSFATFANSAVGQLATVAAGYVGIQQAIGVVNEYLTTQEQLLARSLEKQMSLAQAQQEAAKNFAALTTVQQSELLTQSVPEIAAKAGVGDVVAITNALGGAVSGGATNEQAISAVTSAAMLNRLTPEKIAATSSAAVDFGKATGESDARANIALLTSTGTQSRIEDPQKLAQTLAPTLSNAVNTVPGQDRPEATREAAAIFAAFTQATADTQGDSSKTATIQFTSELAKFFGDFEKQQRDARSALVGLQKKIDEGTATESEQFRANQLTEFVAQSKAIADPGTLFGRIEALQQNPAIRDQFFSREFGEQQFKGAFQALANPESRIAAEARVGKANIEVDSSGFDRLLEATSGLTSQLKIANAVAQAESGVAIQEAFDAGSGALKAVRDITEKALTAAQPSGFIGGLRSRLEVKGVMGFGGIQSGGLAGSNAIAEGISAITAMSKRRDALAVGGIDASEELKVQQLDNSIAAITTLLEGEIAGGTFNRRELERGARSSRSAAQGLGDALVAATVEGAAENQQRSRELLERLATAMDKQNELMTQQNQLLNQTAENTTPPKPNPGDTIRAATAQSDARAPR